jgi:photosystem II stability/assembly factor-like uncharacterized protein
VGGLPTQKTVYAFAYEPKNPTILYASLREGLYLSKDEGKRWTLLDKSPKTVVAIAIDAKDTSRIFVATADGRIFLSQDSGHSWQLRNK